MNPIVDRLQEKKAEIDSSQVWKYRARYKHIYDSVKSYDDLINILKDDRKNITFPEIIFREIGGRTISLNEEQRIITKVFTISNIVPLVLDLLNEEQRKELKNILMVEPDKYVVHPSWIANRSGPYIAIYKALVPSVKYALGRLTEYYKKMNPIVDRLQEKRTKFEPYQWEYKLYDSVKSYDDLIKLILKHDVNTKIFTMSNIVPLVLDLLNEKQRKGLKNVLMGEISSHGTSDYAVVSDSARYALKLIEYFPKSEYARLEYCPHIESFSEIMKKVAEKNSLEVKCMNEPPGEEAHRRRKIEKEWGIFYGNKRTYKVQQKYERGHEFGVGGHDLDLFILFKTNGKDEKLLESKDFSAWYTYSDDSADFPCGEDEYTILYSEDKFARGIFEEIREMFLEGLIYLSIQKRGK